MGYIEGSTNCATYTEGRRGRSEEGTEREEGWLVLTPVIALMYDLI